MAARVGKFGSYISIHAPREGGDGRVFPFGVKVLISIHAPREGGDFSSETT